MTAQEKKGTAAAVNGACGRMGKMIVRLIADDGELSLGAALEASDHPKLGEDVGTLVGLPRALDVLLTDDLDREVDVMIDFSLPAGTERCLDRCVEWKIPMVIGTTGLDERRTGKVHAAAEIIPVVFAPNMSAGVNVLLRLAGEVARALGEDYDVEIVEVHHRFKKDAPSGTALKLAEAIADARGRDLKEVALFGREGAVGERPRGVIGIHAVRAGDIVGEHTIIFSTLGERVELTHRASSRETFARGALRAAKFVLGKKPGLYTMQDVLGL